MSNRRPLTLGARFSRAGRHLNRAWRTLTSSSTPIGSTAFKGASINHTNADWPWDGRDINKDLVSALRILRNRARWLENNNPFATGFLNIAETGIFGSQGITSKAAVRDSKGELDPDLNGKINAGWLEFWNGPVTLDRQVTGPQADMVIWRTFFRDGEAFVRLIHDAPTPSGFAIQLIDPARVDERFNTPRGPHGLEVRMGVEIDDLGIPKGYYLRPLEDFTGYAMGGYEHEFVEAYDPFKRTGEMLHYFQPNRFNQTRGFTRFHAVMENLNQSGAFSEAEVIAARAGAMPIGIVTPEEDDFDDGTEDGASKTPVPIEEIPLNPMQIIRTRAGEKFEHWSPTHPNTAFGEFMDFKNRELATGVNGQAFQISNDLTKVNYSSARVGLLHQQDVWKRAGEHHIAVIRIPIRDMWLTMAMLTGSLKLPSIVPSKYRAATHRVRGHKYLNPLQEQQAIALALQTGGTSYYRVAEEQGLDFEQNCEENARAHKFAASLGVSIDPPGSLAADIATQTLADAVAAAAPNAGAGSNGDGRTAGLNGHDRTAVLNHALRRPASTPHEESR